MLGISLEIPVYRQFLYVFVLEKPRYLKIASHFSESFSAQTLWPLQWKAQSSGPDHLGQATQSSRDSEEHGVVLHLGHTVVLKQNAGVSVYIWPWVLGFTLGQEDVWNKFVDLGDQFEHIVVWKVFESELSLASVPWVGLSEHRVSVAWHDSARLQGVPDEVVEFLVGNVLAAEILSELGEPDEDFLVGETVEWAGETVHGGGEGEVWVGEGRTNQMTGVRADVATFMIGMNGQVQPHQFSELFVIVPDHIGKILGPIGIWVDNSESGSVSVEVVVDLGGHTWKFGDQVHGVLERVFPVFGFVGALGVLGGEDRFGVERVDGGRELSHWVEVGWEVVEHLHDVGWKVSSARPLLGELFGLGVGWDFAGNQQPEQSFWQWFSAFFSSWQNASLQFWNGVSLESDSLDWIEHRSLPNHGLHASHTTVNHVDVDFADLGLTVLGSKLFDFSLLLWDHLDDLFSEGGNISSRVVDELLSSRDQLSEGGGHFRWCFQGKSVSST